MADLSSTIELVFRGIDNASSVANTVAGNIGSSFDGVGGKIEAVAAPLADLANKLLAAEAAVLAMGAALGAAAVNEATKFEDSLYLVKKQLDESGPSIEQARADIEGLGLQYGINANDVANSMAGFLAAGHDYEASASLVKTATQLMIAGELDGKTATEALNQSLAGFRVPADEAASSATRIGDVLNNIGDISSGKFEEIVQGFTRISPVAKDAGLNMENTAGAIAVLVDVFKSGEIAATALKSGLMTLLDPSKEAKEKLAALGVATKDASGEQRSASLILIDLAGKWGALTDAQKGQTAAIIFGKEQAGTMSTLLGGWGEQQEYVSKMMDTTTGAVGSMQREVDGKLALISTSVDRTNEAWRQFLEHLGAKIVTGGSYQSLIDNTGALGNAFKAVVDSGGLEPLLSLVREQMASLSELLGTVAENLPAAFEGLDWSGVTGSLTGLQSEVGDLFTAMFGNLDLTTVEGLRSALQAVMDTFASLTFTVTGIVDAFNPVAAAIGATVSEFNNLDSASKIEFGETIGSAKAFIDVGIALGASLLAIGAAGISMSEVLKGAFAAVQVVVNPFQIAFDGITLLALKAKEGGLELNLLEAEFYGNTEESKKFAIELEKVKLEIEAVTANANKNKGEFKEGIETLTGVSNATAELTAKNEAAKTALAGVGEAAKAAGFDFKALASDVEEAIDGVKDTISGLENITINMPEFPPPELPEFAPLDFGFTMDDLVIDGDPFYEVTQGITAFTLAADAAKFGTNEFVGGIRSLSDQTLQSKTSIEGVTRSVTATGETMYSVAGVQVATMTTAMTKLADGSTALVTTITNVGDKVAQYGGKVTAASKEATALQAAQKALGEAFSSGGTDVGKITAALNTYMTALGSSGKLTTDQFINLTKVLGDYKAKMEEIASNERIANIEANVSIKTAQLEADVKRVQALFASIDTTITSTGDLLGKLFGLMVSPTTSSLDKSELQEQIDLENKRRQEALDLQKKLAEAEIDRIKAQTEAMNRGDSGITITADGLEPELEAFMWKILAKIRMRANAEFSEYLMGMGVGGL